MPRHFRQWWSLIYDAVTAWFVHRASSKGAAVAFYTMLSLAPILILVIGIAGYFFGTQAAQGELQLQLRALIGDNGAQFVQAVVNGARNESANKFAAFAATIILLVGATSVFAEVKASLDEIWEIRRPAVAGLWSVIKGRLLSFSLILVLAFLLLISLVVSAALAGLEKYWLPFMSQRLPAIIPVSALVSFTVIAMLFAAIYKLLPEAAISWRDVLPGAILTAALFSIGKYLIGLYLGNSAVASSFGAAGSLVALLLWVYYSSQIFFFGAEFTRLYVLRYGSKRSMVHA